MAADSAATPSVAGPPKRDARPLDRMSEGPGFLREAAFRELLDDVWVEDDGEPGTGLLTQRAPELLADLLARLEDPAHPDRHRIAFLLGLMAEARAGAGGLDESGVEALQARLTAGVTGFLALLDTAGDPHLADALLWLLAHFPDHAPRITAGVEAALGADSGGARAMAMVFETDPARRGFAPQVLAYLGADACRRAVGRGLELARETLACPACRGSLRFEAREMRCAACERTYGYRGDVLDLVPPDADEADEFPPALVAMYETVTRPRFVRVMGRDWHGAVDPEREARWLERHVDPGDGPVLDLGCGSGLATTTLARLVGPDRVVALDYSVAMLEACREKLPRVLPVRGSASRLPVGEGVFGAVSCSDALQAFPDPRAALDEVGRCLRPGGTFTCFTFRGSEGPYRYFQRAFPRHERHLFEPEELAGWAEAAGMEVLHLDGPGDCLFMTARAS